SYLAPVSACRRATRSSSRAEVSEGGRVAGISTRSLSDLRDQRRAGREATASTRPPYPFVGLTVRNPKRPAGRARRMVGLRGSRHGRRATCSINSERGGRCQLVGAQPEVARGPRPGRAVGLRGSRHGRRATCSINGERGGRCQPVGAQPEAVRGPGQEDGRVAGISTRSQSDLLDQRRAGREAAAAARPPYPLSACRRATRSSPRAGPGRAVGLRWFRDRTSSFLNHRGDLRYQDLGPGTPPDVNDVPQHGR
ncbi:MAG: hypothetical protein JWN91_582, partial [Nocardioides sp.]|nr:hypothetical protein [Nocardioides sp.]